MFSAVLINLYKLFAWFVRSLSVLASAWIFVIMVLITLDILLRFLFGAPLSGVIEIVQISIVIILFMQVTHALKVGRITRSDALFKRILEKRPKIGNAMGVAFSLAGVFLMGVIVQQGWPKWLQALERGYFIGNTDVFTIPEWPQRLMVVIGCTAMAIQFLIMGIDHLRAMMGKQPLETAKPIDIEAEAAERSNPS
jgi:TRAP-type mannitol/chloroaromatic compound transport system permease small subunit